MPSSDAIVIGENWISEHYFGTDANSESFKARVLERRKVWEAERAAGTVRTRFTALRGSLVAELPALDTSLTDRAGSASDLPGLYGRITMMLGYDRLGLTLSTDGPLTRVAATGLEGGGWTAVVAARPVDALETLLDRDQPTLLEPYHDTETTTVASVSRCLSALFVAEDHPDFALVLAGRFLLVAERERWPEGRYLAVDLQLVAERSDDKRGGEVDRALVCLSAESLAPDAEGTIWWRGVLAESVRHTVGVSADLREGVRLSIEIIANDVVARRKAAELAALPAEQAQPLARQALRFLYRILFLLFAEASPELGVLPVGVPEYERGYSLDRLRDLTLVELASPRARAGRHLYASLAVLFRLVDQGHAQPADADAEHEGLSFQSLRADLFRPAATALIDEAGLSNHALQRALQHLLLSKQSRVKDRGFISYAELGINQLGAVYEGLMSYTGSFANTDLYEVAKNGDNSKGSWLVPAERADGIAPDDFVKTADEVTGEPRPVLHERGSFVFRLAGRERQQSASYYTPEVLTRFVVSQALEELLDQDGPTTPAREILRLTVCEPALGSGAFAIEATRQLAEQYLTRRQREVGRRIDPDVYPRELQRVKASIALHQVYGVDLNATAVELAEISLWLDTMVEGLAAPWFGLHLRRGNSLVGARRAVYSRDQVSRRTWQGAVPRDVPMAELVEDIRHERVAGVAGSVPHFLLPAEGWGSAVAAKEAKALAPERMAALKIWRKTITAKPSRGQVDDLVELSYRVERLWQIAYQRLSIAEQEIRRHIPLWGHEAEPAGRVGREEIEAKLADVGGAYQRLRRLMDGWNALWFWPLTDQLTTVDETPVAPPTLAQWITAAQQLLGRQPEARKPATGQRTLAAGVTWEELGQLEHDDLAFAGAASVERVLAEHPWLVVCERIAQQQGFFHWELDFAPVFGRGGFDLQLGNPPWYEPAVSVDESLAEFDPRWRVGGFASATEKIAERGKALSDVRARDAVLDDVVDVRCSLSYLTTSAIYPELRGLRADLYRNFIAQSWANMKEASGVAGLIHLESHFTHETGGDLRKQVYHRLRRHWQFQNELKLFEIQNQKKFGVNIYGSRLPDVHFLHAAYLYHPETLERSLLHDGSGAVPGLKDLEGNWDRRPHRTRVQIVTSGTLSQWQSITGWNEGRASTLMSYAVVPSTSDVLEVLSRGDRIGNESVHFSSGWTEGSKSFNSAIEQRWNKVCDLSDAILQGSHISILNPFYKVPNSSMKSNVDWTEVLLTDVDESWLPTTLYQYRRDVGGGSDHSVVDVVDAVPASSLYRLAWRKMVDNSGSRSLYACILPPGPTHLSSLNSMAMQSANPSRLVEIAAMCSSLLSDLLIRSLGKDNIYASTLERLPLPRFESLSGSVILRTLRLVCLTRPYADLWKQCFQQDFAEDQWTSPIVEEFDIEPLSSVPSSWDASVGLKKHVERRQALLELDALVAIALGVSIDQLCDIQSSMFPTFLSADRRSIFDVAGCLVPNSVLSRRKTQSRIAAQAAAGPVAIPAEREVMSVLTTRDREADMRQAYAHFEARLRGTADG